jgi:aspartate/methionine/tyrosine aminotransferase
MVMIAVLLRFLPKEKRALIDLVFRIYGQLDTPEERKDVADYCRQMLSDGKIGLTEWSSFGKKLGVFRLGK